jgi:MFS family permease
MRAMAPDPATTQRQALRRLIFLLGVACFAGTLSARVTDPFVAALAEEFAAPAERVALLATAFALPFALIQPFVGPVGDALGKRRVIQAALCLLAVFTLAAPLAPDLGTLIVLRGATSAAAGGIMPLTLAALGDAVPIRDRQVALSRLLVFGIGGQIAGGALAGLLAPALGWRGVLGLCGGIAAAAAALVMLLGPAPGPPEPRLRFARPARRGATASSSASRRRGCSTPACSSRARWCSAPSPTSRRSCRRAAWAARWRRGSRSPPSAAAASSSPRQRGRCWPGLARRAW